MLEFWYHINVPNVGKTDIEFFGLVKIEYNVGGTFVYLLKKVTLHCKISS